MKKRSPLKRIMALAIVIVLAVLYLVTFVLALTGSPATKNLFTACFVSTIVLPVLLWIMNYLAKLLSGKDQDD